MQSLAARIFCGVFVTALSVGACASDPLGVVGERVDLGAPDATLWDSAITEAAQRLVQTRGSLALGREAGRELLGIDAGEGLELVLKSIEAGPNRRESCGRTPGPVKELGAWLVAPGDRIVMSVRNTTDRFQRGWLVELPSDGELAVDLGLEPMGSKEVSFVAKGLGPSVFTIVPTSGTETSSEDVDKRHGAVRTLLGRNSGRVLLREYAIARHLSRPDFSTAETMPPIQRPPPPSTQESPCAQGSTTPSASRSARRRSASRPTVWWPPSAVTMARPWTSSRPIRTCTERSPNDGISSWSS